MPLYSYKAITHHGDASRGIHHASCLEELESHLARSNLYLIHAWERRERFLLGKNNIPRRDLIAFFLNLELLLHSGIPLLESLSELQESMDSRPLREIIAGMAESIQSGDRLSQAMARHPSAFDGITTSLIRAGEESGRLPEMLGQINASLKWLDEMSAQTRNMLIYPALAGTAVIAAAFFLIGYLVPQLAEFIRGMGHELPVQTRLLLGIADMFAASWPVLLALPALLAALLWLAPALHPELQYRQDQFKLRCWLIGPILHKIILARFARAFAMMYASGISILDCLAHTRELAGNRVIAGKLEQAAREIESGMNLTQSFHGTGIFPPLAMRMISVGETTGQLEAALRNVGYFYERDVKESVRRMQALLEPAMTVSLGLLLGWVMLSVLSPIYDIIGGIKL